MTEKTNRPLLILLTTLSMVSCEMLESHPYDVHITGERGLTEKNIRLIEQQTEGKKEIRFAVISDTQRWYDETDAVRKVLNQRDDIDFILHTGDQSDFGATDEFLMMRDIFQKFDVPYVCLLGNHDCLGTGENTYMKIYGAKNFAFTAGNVRFICLNTNALEYDYSEPVPNFDFIERELNNLPDEVEKTVFAMHVKPFDMEFNNNVAKVFQLYLNQFPNVQFCVYGHGHKVAVDDLFEDGIIYYQCPWPKKRIYLLFTIKEDGTYDYETIEY